MQVLSLLDLPECVVSHRPAESGTEEVENPIDLLASGHCHSHHLVATDVGDFLTMGPMKPPIIIVEDGDLQLYPSARDAALDLEAMDVRDGIYTAYDSEGRLLKLGIKADKSESVTIEPGGEPDPTRAAELREALGRFLANVMKKASLEKAELPELIEQGMRFFKLNRKEAGDQASGGDTHNSRTRFGLPPAVLGLFWPLGVVIVAVIVALLIGWLLKLL